MESVLFVGLGGMLGSILRYGLGRIPIAVDYPMTTMLINFLGCFVIGFFSEFAKHRPGISPNAVLFIQTGLCGGFTTFSTFSLETIALFQSGKHLIGLSYVALSVLLCLAGTLLGICAARLLKLNFAA